MLRKYASLQVLEAWQAPGTGSISKRAHRVMFDYEPRPGFLYVRSRMISSRTNDNHDTFPAGEIEAGYRTFLGKPVFVNHHNANHRRARGVIVAVALHRDRNPDRTPDTWVEGLMEIDALRFPKLAQAILARKVNRTSMGVDVEWSTCSHCGNKATSPAEYCRHLPAMKGKKARKTNTKTGKVEEKLIHEICAGLSFFENSLLVEDPADPTAYVLGDVDARGLGKTAAMQEHFSHCMNCGVPLLDMREPGAEDLPGDWRHPGYPGLCMNCAIGPLADAGTMPGTPGKMPPLHPSNKGGYQGRPAYAGEPGAGTPGEMRDFAGQDRVRQSMSARTARTARTAAKRAEGGDHPWFRAHPVSKDNIVAMYHGASDDEKALGDRWYSDAHHIAKGIAGGNAALGAGLLSAYSPQTAWPVNMFNASRAAQGDPPGPGSGAMGSHQKSAMRLLAGEHHSKVLTSPKTSAFAHLIEHGGDTPEDEKAGRHKVVIDRHAMSVAVGHRLLKAEGEKAPIGGNTPQHYEHVAQLYRDAAHDISKATGRKVSPHQVQATTWLHQVRKNKEEDASGTKSGGKGRVNMQTNSQERWEHHHKHHHPGAIPEHNMHYHGRRQAAWTAEPEYCHGCGEPIGEGLPGAEPRHREVPHLCVGCGHDAALDPGGYEMLHDRHRGVGERFRNDIRGFGQGDMLRSSLSVRKTAYGETRVPPQVDTLRMEECPVCGEHDVWSGDRCPVCGFVVPPSLFRDPDTDKAKQVREELDADGEVTTQGDGMMQQTPGTGPDGQIGSGEDADDQLDHPDQLTPNGVPTVQGPGGPQAGPDTDGQPPAEEGEEPEDDGMAADGELPGQQGQEEVAAGQQLEEQGEEQLEQGQEEIAEGQQLEEQGEEDELEPAEPEDDLECPACGAQFAIDGAAQPGVPCPACKMAALVPLEEMEAGGGGFPPDGLDSEDEAAEEGEEPGGPQKEQEGPEAESEEEDEGEDKMAGNSRTGAANALARAQAHRIAELTARNEVLAAQLSFLARAAGVDQELAQIQAQVLRRHADVLNPASPVPDPPEAPATQSTEQALMSGSYGPAGNSGSYPDGGSGHSMDDPSRPGTTPGANQHVPADQTTTAITPGVEMQTPPATNLVDVTAPVQGTNPSQDGGVPLSQRRIETDVRIDPDPLKAGGPGIGGQGNNGTAFPWMLDARQPQGGGQQQKAAGLTAEDAATRTYASIRLAKLRVTAGLARGEELAVAAAIEKDASLPLPVIEHEIKVLSAVRPQAAVPQRPMQRAAARQAPSLASVGAMQQYASAASYADDLDGSDLFF